MVKVGGCVYQEVFKKQLLIIKVIISSDCFPEQGFEILHKKQLDFICPRLDSYHEFFMHHQPSKRVQEAITNYKGHYKQ